MATTARKKKLRKAEERKTRLARDAGMPLDQVKRFTKLGYAPLPWQMHFHAAARRADKIDGPLWIGSGGARGPGKTHAALAQLGLDDCQRKPGVKALFLRKKKVSAKESLGDKAREIFRHCDAEITNTKVVFSNGSRIVIGGFWSAAQAVGYLGIEYDAIVVEEATQLTEDVHDESRQIVTKVRGSMRTNLPGWRARAYLTTNPGGPGHAWFKENFVIPRRKGNDSRRFIGGKTTFFPATWEDNPFLSQDYIEYLKAIKGPLGKAWRDGDWDTFAGMAFPEWNYDTHVIDPRELPYHLYWRCVDWGRTAPMGALWIAKDLSLGRLYVTREAYQTNLSDQEQAKLLKDMTPPNEEPRFTFADPAMWAKSEKREGEWRSTADIYRENGVPLTKADNSRLGGKRKVHNALADLPDGKPGLQVFSSCKQFIRTMANLPLDKNRPEDVDTDAEEHLYDALRYGLTNVKRVKEPSKDRPARRPTIRKSVSKIL